MFFLLYVGVTVDAEHRNDRSIDRSVVVVKVRYVRISRIYVTNSSNGESQTFAFVIDVINTMSHINDCAGIGGRKTGARSRTRRGAATAPVRAGCHSPRHASRDLSVGVWVLPPL
jgi:hypothetical protein